MDGDMREREEEKERYCERKPFQLLLKRTSRRATRVRANLNGTVYKHYTDTRPKLNNNNKATTEGKQKKSCVGDMKGVLHPQ
jgi:hypothetical protein